VMAADRVGQVVDDLMANVLADQDG
jgi:hypothetical protein